MSRINPYKLFVGSFLPNWLLRLPELQSSSKLVYGRLCQYAGDKGYAYPSLKEIAEELGLGVRTVQRGIDELEAYGLLEAEQQGKRRTNRYFFLSHPAMKARVDVGGQNGQTVGGQDGYPRMVKMATPIERESSEKNHSPQPPKGEPDGFAEIWKCVWRRGEGKAQPRKPALKAYIAALKRGDKHEEILAAIKARAGVDKPDTEFAPHLSTWLNEERWKDVAAGTSRSAEEIAAATKRHEEAAQRSKAHLDSLARQRSNQLLGLSDDAA